MLLDDVIVVAGRLLCVIGLLGLGARCLANPQVSHESGPCSVLVYQVLPISPLFSTSEYPINSVIGLILHAGRPYVLLRRCCYQDSHGIVG